MPQLDLSEFRPIPNHPSYLLAADGRVATLKKNPVALLKPQGAEYGNGVWLRVTLDRYTYRLRDLVRLIWGHTHDFRAQGESADDYDPFDPNTWENLR